MRNKLLFIIVLLGLNSVCFSQDELNYIEGELLVQLEKKETISELIELLNKENMEFDLKVIKPISKYLNIWRVSFNKEQYSQDIAMNAFINSGKIKVIQNNHTNIERRTNCPSDPSFGSQWNFNNSNDADVDACEAWDLSISDTTKLGHKIVVAVIDGGFDLNHNDLNFFSNTGEISNDGIDNDGNGYIDDTLGWNAYNSSGNITADNHGTHVAGIVGAIRDNGIGVTGIAPGMQVLAVQGSSGLESTVLEAYGYVLDQRIIYDTTNGLRGAFVVSTNSSFGISGQPSNYPLWCGFYDSLGQYGILSVAATYNSNTNVDVAGDIPTACPSEYLITVTNTTSADTKATAGYGLTTIDLGAPGQGIYSTYPNSTYSLSSGTSMASPHVAGAIGFLYSVACTSMINDYIANPSVSVLVFRDAILNGTDPLTALNGITTTGGRLNLNNSSLNILNQCVTSVLEDNKKNDIVFEIYPNPSNGKFNVMSGNKGILRVYSITGQLIKEKNIIENKNYSFEIEKNGMYFITLQSGSNLITKRLIIQ